MLYCPMPPPWAACLAAGPTARLCCRQYPVTDDRPIYGRSRGKLAIFFCSGAFSAMVSVPLPQDRQLDLISAPSFTGKAQPSISAPKMDIGEPKLPRQAVHPQGPGSACIREWGDAIGHAHRNQPQSAGHALQKPRGSETRRFFFPKQLEASAQRIPDLLSPLSL